MLTQASLITWPAVLSTSLCNSMRAACLDFDIELIDIPLFEGCNGSQQYELLCKYKNTITWFCFSRSEEQIKKNRNCLFFENGLLDRGRSYYLDDNGFCSTSNIVCCGYNKKEYSESYVNDTYSYLKTLGWPIHQGYKTDGPIIIAMQGKKEDEELVRKCKEHIPKELKVIIRCHPKDKDKKDLYSKYLYNENWGLDTIKNEFESLSRCRALVVNNSSLMFKALIMGIPVAACSRGFHNGTTAVFDCSRNESLLKHILDFRFEEKSSQNLICAIKESSVSRNTKKEELLKNSNFVNWMKRII